MPSAHRKFGGGMDGRAMGGDKADQADQELNNFVTTQIASICAKAKADDEGDNPIKPGETRLCDDCYEPIEETRLKALPRTKLCITCKEKVESSVVRRKRPPSQTYSNPNYIRN